MGLDIADTFLDAARNLGADEARQLWTFVKKMVEDPKLPGLSLERIERSKATDLWSARVSQDVRAILRKNGPDWCVLYADRHDRAYDWAHRAGATAWPQVNVRAGGDLAPTPAHVLSEPVATGRPSSVDSTPGLFDPYTDAELASIGVTPRYLPFVRRTRTQNDLYNQLELYPHDVGERLCELALGQFALPATAAAPLPETTCLYRVASSSELVPLLNAPFDTWMVFLHPSQRSYAEGSFKGPLKLTGAAGTGKTVVAVHRACRLARQGRRVWLTTFVRTLSRTLVRMVDQLCDPAERGRITVDTVHSQARGLVSRTGRTLEIIKDEAMAKWVEEAARGIDSPLTQELLLLEWETVIRPQRIETWEQYRSASRAGRGVALSVRDRLRVWPVFDRLLSRMATRGEIDFSGLCIEAIKLLEAGATQSPFDAVIVDEMQDLGAAELRFVAAMAGSGPDSLTLVGDGGQRIFGHRLRLGALGIDVRGRSRTLQLNYRTTEQIRRYADRILESTIDDLDDGTELRLSKSLFGGPEPNLKGFATEAEQSEYVVAEARRLIEGGFVAGEIAVFAPRNDRLKPLQAAFHASGIGWRDLGADLPAGSGVWLGTMHKAKGLEFKVVFVVDASVDGIRLPSRYQKTADDAAREDALARNRHLLYVAITRARDEVHITWVGAPSPLLPAAAIREGEGILA